MSPSSETFEIRIPEHAKTLPFYREEQTSSRIYLFIYFSSFDVKRFLLLSYLFFIYRML